MRLIKVSEFAQKLRVRTARGYELVRQLPPGIKVKCGRQIRINEDALDEWIVGGGHFQEIRRDAANGNRKPPQTDLLTVK